MTCYVLFCRRHDSTSYMRASIPGQNGWRNRGCLVISSLRRRDMELAACLGRPLLPVSVFINSALSRYVVLHAAMSGVFLPSVRRVNTHALYVGLGPTPHAALQHCVDAGLIRQDQFLGSFPHPSTNAGDQVPFFRREKTRESITPGNPLLPRADWLDQAYTRMSAASSTWRKHVV